MRSASDGVGGGHRSQSCHVGQREKGKAQATCSLHSRLTACMVPSSKAGPRCHISSAILSSPPSPPPPTPVLPPSWAALPCLRHVADGMEDKTQRQLPDSPCVVGQQVSEPLSLGHTTASHANSSSCSEVDGPPSYLTTSSVTVLYFRQLPMGTSCQWEND